jgi:glycosyltransferase involved in cell wall biosynthesis
MNRLITSDPRGVTPSQLPPPRRQGPARILFVHSNHLGFINQGRQLKAYAATRDDIDAVHVDVRRPLWVKVLGKNVPISGAWDLCAWRNWAIFRRTVGRWLRGPLPIDRFDVIHITTQGSAGAVLDLRGAAPTRWSVYLDSTAALEVRQFGASPIASAPMRRAEHRTLAAADLVTCMSDWAARSAIDDYAIRPDRVFVSPGCVPLPARSDDPAARLNDESLPSGDERDQNAGPVASASTESTSLPRILFIGNGWQRKGGPDLLRLHQQRFADRAHLDIISADAPRDPSARNVTWHGRVDHETILSRIIPTADLFVLPTRHDMSPWVVLEAAGGGLPVVATRVGAIPEMVVDGRTGLLVDRGDPAALAAAVDRLLVDAPLRRQMGLAAARHVREHYDPDRVYNQLMDRLVRLAG